MTDYEVVVIGVGAAGLLAGYAEHEDPPAGWHAKAGRYRVGS
jgi:hypothetical protein